jgi:hypothetical protein
MQGPATTSHFLPLPRLPPQTPTTSASASFSTGASPTRSGTATGSGTPSITPTATITPSGTPSPSVAPTQGFVPRRFTGSVCTAAAQWAVAGDAPLYARPCTPLLTNSTLVGAVAAALDARAGGVRVSCSVPHGVWRSERVRTLPVNASTEVAAGTLCTVGCAGGSALVGPRAWMCDLDGAWRPAAAWSDLAAASPATATAASGVALLGQAGHLVAAAGVALVLDDTPLQRSAAYSVDCGAASSLARHVGMNVSVDGWASTAGGMRCVATAPAPPAIEPAGGSVCEAAVRTPWSGVPPQPWAGEVLLQPPFSTAPYAVSAWTALQADARRPVHRYRLYALTAAVVGGSGAATAAHAVTAADALAGGALAACGAGNVSWTGLRRLAAMNGSAAIPVTLTASAGRPAGAYSVVPMSGVAVGDVAAGVSGIAALAEAGATSWDVTAATAQLSRLHAAALGGIANETGRLLAARALNDTALLLVLVGERDDRVGAAPLTVGPACQAAQLAVGASNVWTATAGGLVVSPAVVIASDVSAAVAPVAPALFDPRLVDAFATCATVTATVVDSASALLPAAASSRRLQAGATTAFRRVLVSPALAAASVELRLSARPGPDEVLAVTCALSPPAAVTALAFTPVALNVTAANFAAVRGTVLVPIAAGGGASGASPLLSAVLECGAVSTSPAATRVYPSSLTLRVPVLALSVSLPLVGDVVLTTRDAAARSVWSTATLPLASLIGNATSSTAGNVTAGAAVELLTQDVAAAIVQAVSIQPPPSGVPFALVLNGSSLVVLVAATAQSAGAVPARFAAGSRVEFGGANATVAWVSADGRLLAVRTPPFLSVCAARPRGQCDRLPLAVIPPPLPSRAEMAALALGNENATAVEAALLSGARSLSLPVACPPFCPGASGGAALHVAGVEGSGAVAAVAGLPAPVTFAGRLLQVVPAGRTSVVIGGMGTTIAASALPQTSGISYVEGCSAAGFEDPTSGVCTNASDPRALRCAYGR